MDRMIRNGDLGCFYWEPESMGGYDMGAWDEATRKPTVMMDAFLGVKHTEVSWMMKVRMQSPIMGQTLEAGDIELQARVQHQRKGRIQSVEFHLDKRTAGTYKVDDLATVGTIATFPFTVADASIGPHTAWAKATDNAKNTQTTDTVSFFVGESALLNKGIVENGDKRGGTATWGITFSGAGKYLLAFEYDSPALRGTEVRIDGDSIARIYFLKNTNAYQTFDIDVSQPGNHLLQLTAISTTGLPDIASLRIFPLDGQAVPASFDSTGITDTHAVGRTAVPLGYTLSGRRLAGPPYLPGVYIVDGRKVVMK